MSKEQRPELTAAEIFTPEFIKEIEGDEITIELCDDPPTLEALAAHRRFREWLWAEVINKVFEEQNEAASSNEL